MVPECPIIPLAERVDCFPDAGASKLGCLQRGCCWSPLDERNAPWCFFSTNHGYSVVSEEKSNSLSVRLKRKVAPSLFGEDIEELAFHADMQTVNRLRFKISDAHKQRFEVPHEHVKPPATHPSGSRNYVVELTHNPFGLKVRRASTNKVLFDTTMGPLVFADQYLQLSARLPSHNIYGLGEHVHQNYRHDTNWRTWPIFTRDSFPNGGTHNLYGHYPYFLCLEDESGKSFGVFLMNSNAMEVTLQPAPAVTYRTIGGVLDFYILLGDTPEQVVQEFLELIGKPIIPPYWSLGFQLSRWDYGSLDEVKRTVERNRAVDLPYDVQYTDIDYMEDKKDFTYDEVKFKDLPQFADYLHEKGQKYILILDPAIAISKRINGPYEAYDRGTQKNAWVTEADGKTPLVGEVWPGVAVFPDYTNPGCKEWWTDEYIRLSKEIKHDALWIDMNEVSNFVKGSNKGCEDNNLNYPPFTPSVLDGVLYSKTLCMDSKQTWGNHYDVHSLYGYAMVLATKDALERVFEGNRSLILTRSSFPGVGKYSGHWLGDNAANWNDIKWAIPGMLEFGLFGVPYIGADICGFFDDVSEELCRRWMQVGAFYPFSRNHNAQHYKVPVPFLHVPEKPVKFYSDSNTWTVDRQFLWGKHLLITPVLDPVSTCSGSAYVPDAVWFDYETEVKMTVSKQQVEMYLPADKLGLHIRGGAILPIQRPAVTTVYSRRNPMGLIVALDDKNRAAGELFWDDGDSRGISTKSDRVSVYVCVYVRVYVCVFVLYLRDLNLTLGQNYTVRWDQDRNPVPETQRFDCYPEPNSDETKCRARGCIWGVGVPWCYFPEDYGYTATTVTEQPSGLSFDITRNAGLQSSGRPESPDINTLRVEITYHSADLLQFKIYDPMTKRFEVPVPLNVPSTPETDEAKRLYIVQVKKQPFGIQVVRKSTGTLIWDSAVPGFTFSDLFIQVSTRLSSDYVYGFGETEHTSYKHDLNYHTWGMFTKDQPPGVSHSLTHTHTHSPKHGRHYFSLKTSYQCLLAFDQMDQFVLQCYNHDIHNAQHTQGQEVCSWQLYPV
uniref:Maltase n=1 Tax=Hucho hucho TaxID=62062 RepID=A0A4W5NR19_9TELE